MSGCYLSDCVYVFRTLVSRPKTYNKSEVRWMMLKFVSSLRSRRLNQLHHCLQLMFHSRCWVCLPHWLSCRLLTMSQSTCCLPATPTVTPVSGNISSLHLTRLMPTQLRQLQPDMSSTSSGDARTTWRRSGRARHVNVGWWAWRKRCVSWNRGTPDFDSVSLSWRNLLSSWSLLL